MFLELQVVILMKKYIMQIFGLLCDVVLTPEITSIENKFQNVYER